jgi:hypothetical protein
MRFSGFFTQLWEGSDLPIDLWEACAVMNGQEGGQRCEETLSIRFLSPQSTFSVCGMAETTIVAYWPQ